MNMDNRLDEMRRQIATVALEDAKHAIDQAIDKVKLAEVALTELGDDGRYAVYDTKDAVYGLRRLYSDIGETIAMVEKGPDVDDEDNELEPIYRAQDAAHEARYGLDNEYDLD
jgi:hypothetical protein